ncbi:LOB domain-containing protein 2 [Striga hermonthica]|uniref:LOB domain-containing protein 2 n=1 Tax=Striga hermonthica TaxID=68872 RepID=A0A9N7MFJ2_STRHE|nr:LOB domain-containing protein 2 [Striga hermonthica]
MQRSTGRAACASCKHQRKKCTRKCMLAPFFPAEKAREFGAVQKVFGVSNASKMIRRVKEEERKVAVESLVWEALCRHKDPVLGPYGDYRRVCEELSLYKTLCMCVYPPPQPLPLINNHNHSHNNDVIINTGDADGNRFHGTDDTINNNSVVVDYCPYRYSEGDNA